MLLQHKLQLVWLNGFRQEVKKVSYIYFNVNCRTPPPLFVATLYPGYHALYKRQSTLFISTQVSAFQFKWFWKDLKIVFPIFIPMLVFNSKYGRNLLPKTINLTNLLHKIWRQNQRLTSRSAFQSIVLMEHIVIT